MVSRDCDYLTSLILCVMFGALGGHRFHARKYGTAALMIILTCFTGIGGLIWSIVDLVAIVRGDFTIKEGARLTHHPRFDY